MRNGTCISCLPCYYLDRTNNCVALPANCLQASRDGMCMRCEIGYATSSVNESCIELPPGCARTTRDDSTCVRCVVGWALDDGGNCVKVSSGCALGLLKGPCLICMTGYVPVIGGICVEMPFGCADVDMGGVCTQCKDGFMLDPVTRECYQIISLPST